MEATPEAAEGVALGVGRLNRRVLLQRDPSCDRSNQAGDGTRTRDIQLGKLTLYQLSYTRVGQLV
jgi:hypothetical protein